MSVPTERIGTRGTFARIEVMCAGCGRFGRWLLAKVTGLWWCPDCGGDAS